MQKTYYISDIEKVISPKRDDFFELKKVVQKFPFKVNDYYLSLINWDDPDDPIKKIVIPSSDELEEWGSPDPSSEEDYTVVPGLQHKYPSTALLLLNNTCGCNCRFCFRKRIFMDKNDETPKDILRRLDYIRKHKEISNILLTGGDPFIYSTEKLESIIKEISEADHIRIIRLGSKMPAFNPFRILNDPDLPKMLSDFVSVHRKIYVMMHFSHPRELTSQAKEAILMFQKAGVILANQTPLLREINDDPLTLSELFNELSYAGVPPYYLFQVRPAIGNKMFSVPIEEGINIFEEARNRCSGLAKRAKFVMSHSSGKIEIIGKKDKDVFFRYHRRPEEEEKQNLMCFKSNNYANWIDDYEEFAFECQLDHFSCVTNF